MRFVTPLVLILLQVSPVAAQTVRVTGTSVALAPPPGFAPSSRFPGFEHAESQSAIMVTELPGPFAEISRGLTADTLAARGITLISSTKQLVDGRQALLLKASQPADGGTAYRWMIVSGDAKNTVMIVGTYPQDYESKIGNALKDALLTTRWSVGSTPPDQFEGLGFRISPTPSLKVAGRISNMLMLTESGKMDVQGPNAAVFIVGTSLGPADLSDLKAFAVTRASQTEGLRGLKVYEQRPITIGGEAAYELLAEAADVGSGRRVTLYQVVIPDPQGYVLMQGLVPAPRAGAVIPEFSKVAYSFFRVSR
jgi:hypothetical protein